MPMPRPLWWPPRRPPGSRPPEGQGGLVALPELGPSGGRGPLARLRARPGRRRLAAELRHEALVLLVQLPRRAPLVRRHDPASWSLGARLSRGWGVARPAALCANDVVGDVDLVLALPRPVVRGAAV